MWVYVLEEADEVLLLWGGTVYYRKRYVQQTLRIHFDEAFSNLRSKGVIVIRVQ